MPKIKKIEEEKRLKLKKLKKLVQPSKKVELAKGTHTKAITLMKKR